MKSQKRILVLGSTGLLGVRLCSVLQEHFPKLFRHSRHESGMCNSELTNLSEARELIANVRPDIVINLVALTNVDECQINSSLAYLTNVKSIENVSRCLAELRPNCYLIHVSTDQVYDGHWLNCEEDCKPTNTYGLTKYAGELWACKTRAAVLRTNFLGKSFTESRNSLSDWVFQSLELGGEIQAFDDVYFSPLSMRTLCNAIISVMGAQPVGIFNLGSKSGCSKAQFAKAFASELALDEAKIKLCSIDDVRDLTAYRPRDMRMNVALFEGALKVELPLFSDEIRLIAEEYR